MSGAFDRANWIWPSTLRRPFAHPFIDVGVLNLLSVTPRASTMNSSGSKSWA
jgi:hypothetical protein